MKLIGGGVLVILVLAVLALFYFLHRQEVIEQTRELAAQTIADYEDAFERIPLLTAGEKARLRTFRNQEHVDRATALGVGGAADRDAIARLVADDALETIETNPYYRVARMDHSVPAVTEDAAHLLELIGHRFNAALEEAALPPYRYVVTSGTRTRADQRSLQRSNVNAATKSSHEFGTTVDLHYARFDYSFPLDDVPEDVEIDRDLYVELIAEGNARLGQEYPSRLKAVLGRVLLDLQRDDKVLVIYERRQPVYHITVADDVPAPAPAAPATPPTGPQTASAR